MATNAADARPAMHRLIKSLFLHEQTSTGIVFQALFSVTREALFVWIFGCEQTITFTLHDDYRTGLDEQSDRYHRLQANLPIHSKGSPPRSRHPSTWIKQSRVQRFFDPLTCWRELSS